MSIIIDIKPEVHAELIRQAAAHGVDVGAYAASLLEEAAQAGVGVQSLERMPASESTAAVARRLAGFGKRHGLSLGGGTIEDLLHESRP